MANVNVLLKERNNAKRYVSASAGTLKPAELTVQDGVAAAGTLAQNDVVTLFKLPADCVITNAYFVVKKAAAETDSKLAIKAGSHNLVAETAVGSAANKVLGTFAGKVYTGTGVDVTATVSAAALKSGEFDIVVEYTELGRMNGEFTLVE